MVKCGYRGQNPLPPTRGRMERRKEENLPKKNQEFKFVEKK